MNNLPTARTADIIEQKVDGDLLIYDLRVNKAYILNDTLEKVFNACNGVTSLAELCGRHNYIPELVYLALDELRKNDLIETDESYVSPLAGINRREVVKRIGISSLAALPLISSLTAPPAVAAASSVCTPNAPGCVTSNNRYITNQPSAAVCFSNVGLAGCCSCARTSASFTGGSQCTVVCR